MEVLPPSFPDLSPERCDRNQWLLSAKAGAPPCQLLPGGVISQHEGEHQRARQEAVCEGVSFRHHCALWRLTSDLTALGNFYQMPLGIFRCQSGHAPTEEGLENCAF